MSRARWEPAPVTRTTQPRSTVEINPHTLHLLGACGSPLFDLVLDCGTNEPVTIIKLPADLAHILRSRLDTKLGAHHA